jgi:hypothetical protein
MKKAYISFVLFIISILFISISNYTFAEELSINLISNPSVETVKNNVPKDWFRLKV